MNTAPKKLELITGYISQGMNLVYGAAIIPISAIFLPSLELHYWLVLLSMMGMVVLIDFGFAPTLIRALSYARNGAKNITSFGTSLVIHDNQPNLPLINALIFSSRSIYLFLSLIALVLIGTLGGAYFFSIANELSINEKLFTWIVFILAFSFNIYLYFFTSTLSGIGRLWESEMINIILKFFLLVTSIYSLIVFKTALSFSVSYLFSVLFAYIFASQILKKNQMPMLSHGLQDIAVKDIIRTLLPLSWRSGVVILGAFLITRGSIFIAAYYLPVEDSNKYILTVQLMSVILAFSYLPFRMHIPHLSGLQLTRSSKLKHSYYKVVKLSIFIFILFSIILILFGNNILQLLNAEVSIVQGLALYLFTIVFLLELNHSLAGGLISTSNQVPFVKPAILSGIGILLMSFLFIKFTSLGIIGLIAAQGIIQLMYNNWKWPYIVYKEYFYANK